MLAQSDGTDFVGKRITDKSLASQLSTSEVGSTTTSAADGTRRVLSFARIPDTGLSLLVSVDETRMLGANEVEALTGHPVGGVCPFGLASPLPIYCDVALKTFDEVLPAAGSANSAVRLNPLRLAELVGAVWVDVCEPPGMSR